MKTFLHKLSAVNLALLVLVSTMSFTINKHFCGDYLVDQAVFAEAQNCGMEHQPGMIEEGGCKDHTVLIEGQEDLKNSFENIDLHQKVFLCSLVLSYKGIFDAGEKESRGFEDYSPPLLVYDIHLLDETFLI